MIEQDQYYFLQICLGIISIGLVLWQLIKINRTLINDAQGRLYIQNAEVRMQIIEYPYLRKYFYGSIDITKDDENYNRVRTVAEMYANYLEHLAIQRKNLNRRESDAWSQIILDIYHTSPIIQKLIEEKPQWYSSAFLDIIKNRLIPE